MHISKYLGIAGLATLGLFAGQAFATVCPTAPGTGTQTQGGPTCLAPVGQDGAGTGLQDELNGITKSGSPQIDVYNDQWTPNSFWSIGATGSSENALAFEVAGNSSTNTFGIFDPTNPSNSLQLFSGPAGTGYTTTLRNMGGGTFIASYFDQNGTFISQSTATFGSGNLFGYYLGTDAYGSFYSNPSMNEAGGTTYPDGAHHVVAYQGNGSTKLCLTSPSNCGLFLPNEFLLAWEDTPWAQSDLDYNDFVVMVESVHAVPEPAVLGMFGFGILLIGAATALRRRQPRV